MVADVLDGLAAKGEGGDPDGRGGVSSRVFVHYVRGSPSIRRLEMMIENTTQTDQGEHANGAAQGNGFDSALRYVTDALDSAIDQAGKQAGRFVEGEQAQKIAGGAAIGALAAVVLPSRSAWASCWAPATPRCATASRPCAVRSAPMRTAR